MTADIINVLQADLVGEYTISLKFDDGTGQVVDFRNFLAASSNPAIRVYLEPERFASFRIEHGELVWGDYDLCFPVIDLYLNNIAASRSERVAA